MENSTPNGCTGDIFPKTEHYMYPSIQWTTCCDEMEKALQEGTDREGYGPLACVKNSRVKIGYDVEPITVCPWCGMKLFLVGSSRNLLERMTNECLSPQT